MALSDCPECWNTPCTCGHGYGWMSKEQRIELAAAVLGVDVTMLSALTIQIVPDEHPKKDEPVKRGYP